MFDYFAHVNELSEDKLVEELENLNKRLMKIDFQSPIYAQLLDMIDMAESAYNDILYSKRIKNENSVIDIGEIESIETKPDYDREDVLTALVHEYTKDFKR